MKDKQSNQDTKASKSQATTRKVQRMSSPSSLLVLWRSWAIWRTTSWTTPATSKTCRKRLKDSKAPLSLLKSKTRVLPRFLIWLTWTRSIIQMLIKQTVFLIFRWEEVLIAIRWPLPAKTWKWCHKVLNLTLQWQFSISQTSTQPLWLEEFPLLTLQPLQAFSRERKFTRASREMARWTKLWKWLTNNKSLNLSLRAERVGSWTRR